MFRHTEPPPSRRELLRLAAAGVGAASLSGWLGPLASRAAEAGKKGRACIVLWMDGGPSHIDTWDSKPDRPENNRGPFGVTQTKLPGVVI